MDARSLFHRATVSGLNRSTGTTIGSTVLPSTSWARSKLRRASAPGHVQVQ